jgi:pimeloyl-ACP methyl ester carboxylesterase
VFVEVSKAPIYVEKQGTGQPVLLLHGVPDSADMWQDVMAGLSEKFTCYAPDLPGFYRSGIPSNYQFELGHYGLFINDLLEALGIDEPVTIVAHDWGGIMAMSFACQFPEKVKRFVGGSFPFSHLYKWHPWAAAWRTPVIGELAMLALNHKLFTWELKKGGPLLSQVQIDETYYGKADKWLVRGTILKMYRSATPRYFLPYQCRLESLSKTVPIDLVWGQKDKYVPTHMADMMHPRSKRIVPDCGHWVPLEAPDEILACFD